ncbi:MAG: hypothetical protein AB1733_03290 [Thermodesulfobacteriota bacterium]|jgi:hypothetical protein
MTESLDQQLRNLVEAGWHVIESDFDTAAFLKWRKAAVACLDELMEPDEKSTLSEGIPLEKVTGENDLGKCLF